MNLAFKGLHQSKAAFSAALLVLSLFVFASQASGEPQAPLRVEEVSSLDFGQAPQGDLPRRIAPAEGALGGAATFRVQGPQYRSYTIMLPASVVLQGVDGASPGATILVDQFSSVPAAGANGQLSAMGQQILFVGARRGAIPAFQRRGSYSGHYAIQIIY